MVLRDFFLGDCAEPHHVLHDLLNVAVFEMQAFDLPKRVRAEIGVSD